MVSWELPYDQVVFVGDTHGNMHWWKKIFDYYECKDAIGAKLFIQLGDFGYWPHTDSGQYYLDWLAERLEVFDAELLFIRGNHENQDMLTHYGSGSLYGDDIREIRSERIGWIRDGAQFEVADLYSDEVTRFAGFGGAVSPDRPFRQRYEGTEWWASEEISEAQLHYFTSNVGEVDVLLTHDGPTSVSERRLVGGEGFPMPPGLKAECYAGRMRIQTALDHCGAKILTHGHFHNFHHSLGDNEVSVVGLDKDDSKMDKNTMTLERLLKIAKAKS